MQEATKIIESIESLNKYPFNIKWRLTHVCNYKCSYCIRSKHTSPFNELEEDIKIIDENVSEIARLIVENGKDTRLLLIGGEVTLLPLHEIIEKLHSKCKGLLKRINITSNFSKPVNYFNDLFDLGSKLNIEMSITFSFHPEYFSLESFIAKLKQLKLKQNSDIWLEMVATISNQQLVEDFKKLCYKENFAFIVDPDFREGSPDNLNFETSDSRFPRFKVTTNYGIEYYNSPRELCLKYGINKKIDTVGYLCSIDQDYILIDKNIHVGFTLNKNSCKGKEPISNFRIKDTKSKCTKPCSLCGFMSIFKNNNKEN